MKNYLLFDLDGTLTDPKLGITTCVQYALHSLGIEEPDLDKLECFIGPPLTDSFQEFYGLDDEQAAKAVEKYRERFKDIGLFENEVYRGIPEMLKTLRTNGMRLAVASSKPTVFVERILEHFKIDRYFDVVVGSELDGTRVNKDEVVQEALELLFQGAPVLREQVYMIGDRKFDVEGAKAHGIESVAVAYGYGGIDELKEAGADYIVCSVEELKKLLLLDVEEAEYIREKNATVTQKIWSLVYPLLMFLCVRVLVVNLMLMILPDVSGNVSTLISALSYAAAALMIGANAKWLITKTAEDVRLCHLRPVPFYRYLLLFMAAAGAVVGLNLLYGLTGFIDVSATYQEVAESQFAANLLVGLLCYGLITPVAEELLFRGIIHNGLRRFLNPGVAILVSAAIFGIYHGNVVQATYGFLMGCLLAYGYEYFGKFAVPVLIHIVANVLAYCVPFRNLLAKTLPGWIVCILCLVIAVLTICGLQQGKKKEYKDA